MRASSPDAPQGATTLEGGGGTSRTANHGQSTCNVPKVSSPLSDKFSLCQYTLICRLIIYRVHTHHVRCEEEHVDTFLRDNGLCYLEPRIGHNDQNRTTVKWVTTM